MWKTLEIESQNRAQVALTVKSRAAGYFSCIAVVLYIIAQNNRVITCLSAAQALYALITSKTREQRSA